jgi:hypothetical protein
MWRSSTDFKVEHGKAILKTIVERGWVEARLNGDTREFRITPAGLAALFVKLPISS